VSLYKLILLQPKMSNIDIENVVKEQKIMEVEIVEVGQMM
jgi:hypothetical protein